MSVCLFVTISRLSRSTYFNEIQYTCGQSRRQKLVKIYLIYQLNDELMIQSVWEAL